MPRWSFSVTGNNGSVLSLLFDIRKCHGTLKCNYHTHTMRCHHAVGEDEAYVLAALEAGFDELGFADHAPWPYASHFVSNIRMSMEDFPGYLQSIRRLREKYQGKSKSISAWKANISPPMRIICGV